MQINVMGVVCTLFFLATATWGPATLSGCEPALRRLGGVEWDQEAKQSRGSSIRLSPGDALGFPVGLRRRLKSRVQGEVGGATSRGVPSGCGAPRAVVNWADLITCSRSAAGREQRAGGMLPW